MKIATINMRSQRVTSTRPREMVTGTRTCRAPVARVLRVWLTCGPGHTALSSEGKTHHLSGRAAQGDELNTKRAWVRSLSW